MTKNIDFKYEKSMKTKYIYKSYDYFITHNLKIV